MKSNTIFTQVQFKLLTAGYCRQFEAFVLRSGKFKIKQFPSHFGLIIHPRLGLILYDTGYASHYYQYTHHYPEKLYRNIIPVHCKPEDAAVNQINKLGYRAEDVKYIIISHFHADHIAGLRDFPNAKFICFQSAYQTLAKTNRLTATLHGIIPQLLPGDFLNRMITVENCQRIALDTVLYPFKFGFDLFADNSLIAVELPGHMHGQLGLLLFDEFNHKIFLIADACWASKSFQNLVLPNYITRFVMADWQAYKSTIEKIHLLYRENPEMMILPSHCNHASSIMQAKGNTYV